MKIEDLHLGKKVMFVGGSEVLTVFSLELNLNTNEPTVRLINKDLDRIKVTDLSTLRDAE